MKKQSASKKKTEASHESPVVEPEKPCLKPKKMGSEIDEIFGGKKRKRPEMETNNNAQNPAKMSGANAKSHCKTRTGRNGKRKASTESAFSDSTSRSRKKTADGLAVYTEEELGIGNPEAGGRGTK